MPPIQPRTLKGFRDYLPQSMLPRERIMDTARRVFRSYGFSPIDTPALEYLEILLGKGGAETDKQLYRFQDHGGRDVGLRFDLTVPLARFAAQHIGELGTPFKRYHIATVWRGENTQRGRYREFMQCDFDTIGTKTSPPMRRPCSSCTICCERSASSGSRSTSITGSCSPACWNRSASTEKPTDVLRALDKLAKIGAETVIEEMQQTAGASAEQSSTVVEMVQLTGHERRDPRAAAAARRRQRARPRGRRAARRTARRPSRPPAFRPSACKLDVSIARGLDYYTGTVLETTLDDLPDDRQHLQRRPLR